MGLKMDKQIELDDANAFFYAKMNVNLRRTKLPLFYYDFKIPEPRPPSFSDIADIAPQNLEEFETRVNDILERTAERYHKEAYGIYKKQPVDKRLSIEKLVKFSMRSEKTINKKERGTDHHLDGYNFLKLALEKNVLFSKSDQYILGIAIERSKLTKPKQRLIAFQCAAQTLWYLEQNSIPTLAAMEVMLTDKKQPLSELLEAEKVTNSRTIQKWIGAVCPVPQNQRKKHLKDVALYSNIVPIPGLFTAQGIRFPWLKFAIICTTRVMKICNCTLEDIIGSPSILVITERLKFYPKLYIRDWIEGAYSSNSSIFDL